MQLSKYHINIIVLSLLAIAIILAIPYLPGYDYDRWCWQSWATYMLGYGLQHTYDSGTNYLPLYQYVLYLYSQLCGTEQSIYANVNYLRLVTIAFDWLGLWYVYLWAGKKIPYYLLVLISLVNIGYSYNTFIWGQLDGINASLMFICIYYGYHRKLLSSTLFFILALNMKLQAIIILPVWGYFYLTQLLETKTVKDFVLPLLAGALLQLLILLPFLGNLPQVWTVVQESVGKFPFISLNAFNFWHIALGEKVWNLPDGGTYLLSMSYKQVGLLLFMATSFISLLPLLRALYAKLFLKKEVSISKEQVWLICALISIVFFFFSTQMHERYSHPTFIFITAYSFYKRDFLPYILFSAAYFFNLERASHLLELNNYQTLIFDNTAIAREYAVVMCYLGFRLWRSSVSRH